MRTIDTLLIVFNLLIVSPVLAGQKDEPITGMGTIELSSHTVSDIQPQPYGEWFDNRMSGWIGGVLGTAWGIFGGTIGGLSGILVSRGKGRCWILSLLLFGMILGGIQFLFGLFALILGQPYHVWYPLGFTGGLVSLILPHAYCAIKKGYEQAELRKMQALDS